MGKVRDAEVREGGFEGPGEVARRGFGRRLASVDTNRPYIDHEWRFAVPGGGMRYQSCELGEESSEATVAATVVELSVRFG